MGAKLKAFGIALLAILTILIIVIKLCTVYVRPYEAGIKVVKIGVKRGVKEKVYSPGIHLVIPFGVERMYRFPVNMQLLEFTQFPSRYAYDIDMVKAARIQTSDGFFVDVDLSILYHLSDPYKVMTTLGPGRLYYTNGIIPKAEPILKEALGVLTTEDFYNSPLRYEKSQLAKQLLNQELNPMGITIDDILIRFFVYSEEIQKNIEEKKLKDQLVFKNQAEAKAKKEEAILKKTIEEGKATVAIKLEEGKAYVVKREAEKELYVRKQRAEADLLIKMAEARRTELKNKALQGTGSEHLVGLKMADVLQGLDVIIIPSDGDHGLNPLNLKRNLELFGISAQ